MTTPRLAGWVYLPTILPIATGYALVHHCFTAPRSAFTGGVFHLARAPARGQQPTDPAVVILPRFWATCWYDAATG